MAKTINSDLIRGNINTIILKALFEGDRYGYDIIKEIEIKSHGQYILKQPTLYSCLKRLENQGFIEAYWGEQSSNGGRRKYYRLTEAGKEIFKQNQDEYEYSRTVIDSLISDSQYDLSSLEKQTAEEEMIPPDGEETISAEDKLEKDTTQNAPSTDIFIKRETEEQPILAPVIEENIEEKPEDLLAPPPTITLDHEEIAEKANIEETQKQAEEITVQQVSEAPQETQPTKTHTPAINTKSLIDEMLGYGDKSYFDRPIDSQSHAEASKKSDEIDDIADKLNELQQSYQFLYEQNDEPSENDNQRAQISADTQKESADSEVDSLGFFKYNTIKNVTPKQTEEERMQALNTLLSPSPSVVKSVKTERKATATTVQIVDDDQDSDSPSIKTQLKIRNYGKLSQSIEELGENAKVREHNAESSRNYEKQYYYKDSVLRLYHGGILFLMILAELFIIYTVGKVGVHASTPYDTTFYVLSIILSLAYPIGSAIYYLLKPFNKKRNDYSLKNSLIFRIIICVQLLLIIYAVNIYMGMPITFDAKYFITLLLPMVFAINLPISAIIHYALLKTNKFAANN